MPETDQPTDGKITHEQLEEAIAALNEAEKKVDSLANEFADLETGLTRSDTIALLYGRRNGLNKTDVEGALDTLDAIAGQRERTLLKRLLADLSNLNQSESDEFLDQLEDLRRRYGE